jgi:hypothetical protein
MPLHDLEQFSPSPPSVERWLGPIEEHHLINIAFEILGPLAVFVVYSIQHSETFSLKSLCLVNIFVE